MADPSPGLRDYSVMLEAVGAITQRQRALLQDLIAQMSGKPAGKLTVENACKMIEHGPYAAISEADRD